MAHSPAWGEALAGGAVSHWPLFLWLLLGAIAMRGAGCVYNDIVDRDLDRRIARTAVRPLASGAVSLTAAWAWLATLCLVGLVVWFQLGWPARIVALASLAPVAAYPFMKRITWWPQAWLGIVFSWAALVGWVEVTGSLDWAGALLYRWSLAQKRNRPACASRCTNHCPCVCMVRRQRRSRHGR